MAGKVASVGLPALRDMLDAKVIPAMAARARSKQANGEASAGRTRALAQYERLVTAVELWLGKTAPKIESFGIRVPRHRREKHAATVHEAHAAPATKSAPAPASASPKAQSPVRASPPRSESE